MFKTPTENLEKIVNNKSDKTVDKKPDNYDSDSHSSEKSDDLQLDSDYKCAAADN